MRCRAALAVTLVGCSGKATEGMAPDAGAAGGLKVVRPAEVAPAAESFTIGD